MKIVGLTIITNPTYRQDPWRENIKQQLLVFDEVIVVCGDARDLNLFSSDNFTPDQLKRVHTSFLLWPQPDWSYDELPKHLNAGLKIAREIGADWIIKLDADSFVHEADAQNLRRALSSFKGQKIAIASFEKYQFQLGTYCYEKGKVNIGLNMDYAIEYGHKLTEYNDLCQPILATSRTTDFAVGQKSGELKFDIPSGHGFPGHLIKSTGVHMWNYDYTFKTEERSRELLYNFDRSHAKFWGTGYCERPLEDITIDTAFNDFILLSTGRIGRITKYMPIQKHPIAIHDKLRLLEAHDFGFDLWGKIPMPNLEHIKTKSK